MGVEQVEREVSADEQIVDALVSTREPVLGHVFDRPGLDAAAQGSRDTAARSRGPARRGDALAL
eukprot:2842756-Prymnesium_polylepis.2